MSRFSGKCDFYDFISRIENINEYNIYLLNKDGNHTKLNLETKQDCIPFYNHIVNVSCGKEMYISRLPYSIYEREKYGILLSSYFYKNELNEELKKFNLPLKYKEEECNKDFYSYVEKIGPLFLVISIYDDYSNKIDLCKDNNENLFLIYTKNKFEHKYLFLPIKKEELNNLKEEEINLYNYIKQANDFYMSYTYDMDTNQLKVKQKNGKTIGKKHLPKENFTFKLNIVNKLK